MQQAINLTSRKLNWGLQPDRPCSGAWGARAILEHDEWGGKWQVTMVANRADSVGDKRVVAQLCEWLDFAGIELLREAVKQADLHDSDNRIVEVERPGYRIIANPKRSYGYLYICAMVLAQTEAP